MLRRRDHFVTALVVVTVIAIAADAPPAPPARNEHAPAATGVTVNGPIPDAGATLATAVQSVLVSVNPPEFPACVTVKRCV